MKKILLYGNGSFDNLGCQALSISTYEILKSFGYQDISFLTFGDIDDYKIIDLSNVKKLKRDREDLFNFISTIFCRVGLKKLGTLIPSVDARKKVEKNDIAFSIGGDNYCYNGREKFFRINREIRKKTKRMIFWGASIESNALQKTTIKDLKTFDLIIARETLTFNLLKEKGIENVIVLPDPAFLLEKKEPSIKGEPACISKTIGINLSPLIYSYSSNPQLVEKSIYKTIEYILEETNLNIVFFSHVYGEGNDLDVAKNLVKKYNIESNRITFMDSNYNSMEIKHIISRMYAVICARTHASIASYSSCVPTLVIGYSIKSKGIANDIYGSFDKHVVPVQDLNDEETFLSTVKLFIQNNEKEKLFLSKKIPEYINQIQALGDILKND